MSELNLATYPHHKHDGSEENVLAAAGPELLVVLDEIAMAVLSS